MKITLSGTIMVSALCVLALATGGCESTPLLAPSGSTLTLLANPNIAAPDLGRDPTEDTYFSSVGGQLLDTTTSTPLADRRITFFTSAGNLRFNACSEGRCTLNGALCPGGVDDCIQPASEPLNVNTDSAGTAVVSVAVTETDPATVTVTAISGAINQAVSFANPLGEPNDAPTAEIGASPDSPVDASGGAVTVVFFSESTDPDNDPITCYEWTIQSSTAASFQVRGPEEDLVSRAYDSEQSLSVLLRVTDDPDAEDSCNENTTFSPNVDTLSGFLICTNTAPTAEINIAPPSIELSTVEYLVNGSASSDAETDIQGYSWDCGNGQEPTGMETSCTYTRRINTAFYEIKLVVTDFSLESGCERESEEASQTVTVPALGS